MEYISIDPTIRQNKILCCQCGLLIEPNPSNMCVGCIRTEIDITADIPKQATIQFCRKCERYLQPPQQWMHCATESKELLTLCINKLKGLTKVKLVDAGFVWTEPHSKRIKVKLTIQSEVMGGTILQQVFIVEFTVANQMCEDCHRIEAEDYWKAQVQVRQDTLNMKTFYYLEQLILKHNAHKNTLGIKQIHGGLDFFYATESHARRMVDFLSSLLPIRYNNSKKLLSHDTHSNIYNYRYSFSVEIVPLSKDSLVCLSKKMANRMGRIGSLCLIRRVTNTVHLIDPSSSQVAEVNGVSYWREPFQMICNPKDLIEFTVMDVEPILDKDRKYFPGQGPISAKHVLSDVWVVKSSELGQTAPIHTRSHLGHLLNHGDSVLGYVPTTMNINDKNFGELSASDIPEIILVKKHYPKKRRKRNWKLKQLVTDDEGAIIPHDSDFDEFMDDLEEDRNIRTNVNIYKSETYEESIGDEIEDPEAPHITLEEMLSDLHIDDENNDAAMTVD